MKRQKPEIGSKFNDLTVISVESDKGPYHVKCECVCGAKTDVRMYHLISGNTKSCRCQKTKIEANGQGAVSMKDFYAVYQRNAEKRGVDFSLSFKCFTELAKSNCHYCGSAPKPYNKYLTRDGKQKRKDKKYKEGTVQLAETTVNGIDRKNNDLGYDIHNCVTCCKICNRAKNDMSYEEFMDWIMNIKQS